MNTARDDMGHLVIIFIIVHSMRGEIYFSIWGMFLQWGE
jgi:hypothetical protein